MTFSQSILKKISTGDTKRPDSPQVTIKNPQKNSVVVNGIELILSAEFSSKGKVLILINDVAVFNENDSQGFEGYAKYPIPLGITLRNSENVKVFAWNGSGDSNMIEVSMNVSVSKNPEPFNSQAVPLGKDVFNTVVSESEAIFPTQSHVDDDVTQLIDMKGYQKMILQIVTVSDVISIEDVGDFSDTERIVDRNVLTLSGAPNLPDAAVIRSVIIDFESIAVRNVEAIVRFRTKAETGNQDPFEGEARLLTSETLSGFVTKATKTVPGFSNQNTLTDNEVLSAGDHSMRYAKVEFELTIDSQSASVQSIGVYQVYDANLFGGTSSLSFETLEDQTNQWITAISAAALGSITEGETLSKTIGDVGQNFGFTQFNYPLPSTQTNFRARMITAGGMLLSVSMIRVG